jgi:putative sterol carrier protein
MGSGPPADGAGRSGSGDAGGGNGFGLNDVVARLTERGEAAFGAFVRRSDDRTLERTIGSDPGLRLVFAGMTRRFRPDRAGDFEGDIQYELRPAAGAPRNWVVSIGDGAATARPGRAAAPKVTIGMDVADFARLISRELDPGRALMDGRLRLEGDVMVASRLGEMFGEPGY